MKKYKKQRTPVPYPTREELICGTLRAVTTRTLLVIREQQHLIVDQAYTPYGRQQVSKLLAEQYCRDGIAGASAELLTELLGFSRIQKVIYEVLGGQDVEDILATETARITGHPNASTGERLVHPLPEVRGERGPLYRHPLQLGRSARGTR